MKSLTSKYVSAFVCTGALVVAGVLTLNRPATAQSLNQAGLNRLNADVFEGFPVSIPNEIGASCKIITDRDSGRSKGFGYQIDLIVVTGSPGGGSSFERITFEGVRDEDFCILDTVRTEKGVALIINGVTVEERPIDKGAQSIVFEYTVKSPRDSASGQASGRRVGITIITKNGTEMVIAGPK